VRENEISLRKWPGGTAHAQLRGDFTRNASVPVRFPVLCSAPGWRCQLLVLAPLGAMPSPLLCSQDNASFVWCLWRVWRAFKLRYSQNQQRQESTSLATESSDDILSAGEAPDEAAENNSNNDGGDGEDFALSCKTRPQRKVWSSSGVGRLLSVGGNFEQTAYSGGPCVL